jgi:hypothetical protein
VATLLVAAFPVPRTGTSPAHFAAAMVAFAALTLWPTLARSRSPEPTPARRLVSGPAAVPAPLRPAVSLAATVALASLLGWFGIELFSDGPHVGLSERVLAAAQALWPLCVALAVAMQPATRTPTGS